jgi:hypothetical protein
MSLIASTVDWGAMGEVVVAALVAGLTVTLAFSIAILGATRAVDLRRDGHAAAAWVYGAVGVLGLAVTALAVVLGILAMAAK